MARLNEPPVSTDSIETLRKKFLRQNRDIARVNSNQSLRIRALENECSRLLSENLDLRGRILQLEKENDDNSAHRIADHALQIKAKMEAQLIEWGGMLASLGLEPPTKRRPLSPSGRKIARPRMSLGRSPAQRKRRESKDAPAASMSDGRLPPIQETKTYPRQTMNRDEILALCSEAVADTNDSPDLGPPPTSRFVDPVKVDSPSRSTGVPDSSPQAEATVVSSPTEVMVPKLDYGKTSTTEPKRKILVDTSKSTQQSTSAQSVEPDIVHPSFKAGSKRKFGDENEPSRTTPAKGEESRTGSEKTSAVRKISSRKSVRDLASIRRDEKSRQASAPILASTRKPLAMKSTNDMSSPKKLSKTMSLNDIDKGTSEFSRTIPLDSTARGGKKRIVPIRIQIPAAASAPAISHPLEPVVLSTDPEIAHPDTPEPGSVNERARDTPPPGDISVHGEATRPSRRARPSVSYAEPNLRDKMRRPTKELLDAVSGEGKHVQRSSSAHQLGPTSTTKVKVEGELADSLMGLPTAEAAAARESARRKAVISPLAHKEDSPAILPSSVATERRRRPSSIRENLFEQMNASDTTAEPPKQINDNKPRTVAEAADPYEFHSSSPVNEPIEPPQRPGRSHGSTGSRRSLSTSRGNSSATTERPMKTAVSRKRASMAAPKKSALLDEAPEDDQFESSGDITQESVEQQPTATDRISRRRSMML